MQPIGCKQNKAAAKIRRPLTLRRDVVQKWTHRGGLFLVGQGAKQLKPAELLRIKQRLGLSADAFAALLGMKRWNVAAMIRGDRNITADTAAAARALVEEA